MRASLAASAALLTATATLAACTTSPTGRYQLALASNEEVAASGIASYRDLQTKVPATKDARTSAYVQCVSRAVTAEAGTVKGGNVPESWEVTTFESKDLNAFALPGGKIGVFTGLLKAANNQNQLAAVVGHEVAHVLANHANDRQSKTMTGGVLSQVGSVVAASQGYNVNPELIGAGVNLAFLLPYSRGDESEADQLGLDIMARAGFDPRQSITLWQNMAKQGGGQAPTEFLSTHPSDETRIRRLSEHLNVAMPLYEQARAAGKKPNCTI